MTRLLAERLGGVLKAAQLAKNLLLQMHHGVPDQRCPHFFFAAGVAVTSFCAHVAITAEGDGTNAGVAGAAGATDAAVIVVCVVVVALFTLVDDAVAAITG